MSSRRHKRKASSALVAGLGGLLASVVVFALAGLVIVIVYKIITLIIGL